MDEADRASQEEERNIAEAMRTRRPEGPAPTGKCLRCDDPLDFGARWCDSKCRDEWERMRRG